MCIRDRLPLYQRRYSGERYPRAAEQQNSIRSGNYRHQPREAVTQQHFQQAVPPVQQRQQGPQQRPQRQQEQRPQPQQSQQQQPQRQQEQRPQQQRQQQQQEQQRQ